MRMKCLSIMIAAFFICGFSHDAAAADYRNILALSTVDYESIGTSKVLEDTFIARVHPRFSALARFYTDRRSSWDNTILTAGPVIFLTKYSYCELSYGYGKASNGDRSDFFNLEITRETPLLITGMGYRHSEYENFSIDMVSPSLKMIFVQKIDLFGKYFMSLDSNDNFDHALWMECTARITGKFALGAGFTVGNRLYSPEYETVLGGGAEGSFHSWIVKLSWAHSEKVGVRYQYERLSRDEDAVDIRNGIIFDVRFDR